MRDSFVIRAALLEDSCAVSDLYPKAFPNEDLVPLVRDLLKEETHVFSLGAFEKHRILGHVFFTRCFVDKPDAQVALLGPIAVDPQRQKQGIGSALIQHGFEKLARDGLSQVFVLGDPAYYGRFGFKPDDCVIPPYPLPKEWRGGWRSIRLGGDGTESEGRLVVPMSWQRPHLWVALLNFFHIPQRLARLVRFPCCQNIAGRFNQQSGTRWKMPHIYERT